MLFTFVLGLEFVAATVAAPNAASAVAYDEKATVSISSQIDCNGKTYTYHQLAGYGLVPSRSRDKFGDTLGGFGSSIAIDSTSWKKAGTNSYSGTLWGLPDRGWNTNGTLNYQNRLHKFDIVLNLASNSSDSGPSAPNLHLTYQDSILFTGPDGQPTTSLDPSFTGPYLNYPGFPELPSATYPGDGFGGSGSGGKRISVDSEGIVLGLNGTFWVSDEYGPYIYQLSARGQIIQAIRPPDAFIPHRNGTASFSADSPPLYDADLEPIPADTTTGRNNNQGLEGLTASPDGKRLYALLQSALDQEGGPDNPYRRQSRLLVYDISQPLVADYIHEYVVTLPLNGKKVAAQSEIQYISDTQFLILARDSGNGRGQGDINSSDNSESKYRHADIFDISSATDIHGGNESYDAVNGSIASSKGVLNDGIKSATYCSFLDYNNNTELARFNLHNGGKQNLTLLNEKWESLALVPVDPERADSDQFFLFSISDNDFITQEGYQNFGEFKYQDATGFDLDNQVLVFKVTIPR